MVDALDFPLGSRVLAPSPGWSAHGDGSRIWKPGRVIAKRTSAGGLPLDQAQLKVSLDGYASDTDEWVVPHPDRLRLHQPSASMEEGLDELRILLSSRGIAPDKDTLTHQLEACCLDVSTASQEMIAAAAASAAAASAAASARASTASTAPSTAPSTQPSAAASPRASLSPRRAAPASPRAAPASPRAAPAAAPAAIGEIQHMSLGCGC